MKKKIAVIVTVHNRRCTTMRCFELFHKMHGLDKFDFDFYMVDDGCTDDTVEFVSREFPHIRILKGDGKLYWNRGMWFAWREASCKSHDFYLWLNDDTMLFENALELLFDDYNALYENTIVSGCCCDTETQTKATYGGWRDRCLVSPNGTPQEVEKINGNFVLIPNSVYCRIGNLNPYFRHSFGDFEYGERARKNGIGLFISSFFIGTCNRHDYKKCFDKNISLLLRLKYLYSPLGPHPMDTFYYFYNSEDFFKAIKIILSVHLHCFFPRIWHWCLNSEKS